MGARTTPEEFGSGSVFQGRDLGGALFIPEVGWYPGLDAETYHSFDAVSSHGLMDAQKSILHHVRRKEKPRKETPAMVRGTRLHTAILEPWKFLQNHIIMPDFGDQRTKANKIAKQAWLESVPEAAIVMTEDEAEQTRGMCEAIMNHPIASEYLKQGKSEVSGFVTCPITGLWRKMRADNVQEEHLIDYKTCEDLSEEETFWRAAYNYKYDVQAFWYLDTAHLIDRVKREFLFIAQESEDPWGIRVYVADDAFLDKGQRRAMKGLGRIKKFKEDGIREGYPAKILNLGLPNYAYYDGA
jgi:hypothetical protein